MLGLFEVGMAHHTGYIAFHDGIIMLEYLYLICLLCLTISVPILIRGCFSIHRELPNQGGNISSKIDDVSEVLNELADFIADLARSGILPNPTATQSPPDFLSLLTAFLKRDTPSPSQHGTQEQTEWEILEANTQTTKETETIIDGNSPISSDSGRSIEGNV